MDSAAAYRPRIVSHLESTLAPAASGQNQTKHLCRWSVQKDRIKLRIMEKTKLISLLWRMTIASNLGALVVFWLLGRLKYGTATILLYKRSFCTLRNSKMYLLFSIYFFLIVELRIRKKFLEYPNCSLEQFIIRHHVAWRLEHLNACVYHTEA